MKIKVFKIRLTNENLEADQKAVNDFLKSVEMKKSSTALVNGKPSFWSILIYYHDKRDSDTSDSDTSDTIEIKKQNLENKKPKLSESDLSTEELIITNSIKQWRIKKAQEEMLPAYMILSNADIYSVAKDKPTNTLELLNVHGFGKRKVEKYGDEIISLINQINK